MSINKNDFKCCGPFKLWTIENFPFIEADFDAITNYQLYSKIVEYLKKIAENQNALNNSYNELITGFNTLQTYVDNYFANLDVQDEIDHKLDEMVTDGTLASLFSVYTTRIYDTISDAISDTTIIDGQKIKTLGYYSINDGGGAEYYVTDTLPLTGHYETLDNDMYAVMLIINDTIDFTQLGGKANDSTFDNKTIFDKYVALCDRDNKTYKLKMDVGAWYTSPVFIQRIGGVNIEGVSAFPGRGYYGTQICAIGIQDYIFKFGGESNMDSTTLAYASTNTSNVIKNLTFSSEYTLNYAALVLEYANYGVYEDLYFTNLIGTGLYIRSCWENYFNRINFRSISDFTKPCLRFATTRPITGVSANISSSSFDKLMFEKVSGNCIQMDENCQFVNNQIGEINLELTYKLQEGEEEFTSDSQTDFTIMNPMYVIKGCMFGTTINTINYTGSTAREKYYRASDARFYYYDAILAPNDSTSATNGNIFSLIINNIYLRRDSSIIHTKQIYAAAFNLSIGIITSNTTITNPFIIENGASNIKVGEYTSRNTNNNYSFYNNTLLYTVAYNGMVCADPTAINPLELVLKKSSGSSPAVIARNLYYPFTKLTGSTHKFIIKIKNTNESSQSFTLRGLVSGANNNQTITVPASEGWQNVEVSMNYDDFSPITLLTSSNDLSFESITYVGVVSV